MFPVIAAGISSLGVRSAFESHTIWEDNESEVVRLEGRGVWRRYPASSLWILRCCLEGKIDDAKRTDVRKRRKAKEKNVRKGRWAGMRCSESVALLCLHYLKALINLSLKQTESITQRHKAFQDAITAPCVQTSGSW